MNLFELDPDPEKNWLPVDGTVNYYGKLFDTNQADFFLQKLTTTIEWQNDEVLMFGKKIITKRKVAWYGEKHLEYTYSNTTKQALAWTEVLLELKRHVEHRTGATYNSCLLNLYHNGNEGMGWHSDDEKELLKNGTIASLSYGSVRKFSFKHRTNNTKIDLMLEHGSLLAMEGETQYFWKHQLPTTKKSKLPRVNLTFRTIVEPHN